MSGDVEATSDLISPDVARTLASLPLTDADAGAVKLAQRYAAAIDLAILEGRAEDALKVLGPKLLMTLKALGAVPTSRRGGGDGDAPAGGLAGLRAARGA